MMSQPALGVGAMDLDDPVEPTGPGQRRIEHLRPVRGTDHEDERLVRDGSTNDARTSAGS